MTTDQLTAWKEALSRLLQQKRDSANRTARRRPMTVIVYAVVGSYLLITAVAAIVIILHMNDVHHTQ